MERRKSKIVKVGSVSLGGSEHIVIQSMTKVFTTDVEGCLKQITDLVKAGCELVRIAVPRKADTEAFAKIVSRSPIPLIADIHFSCPRAVEAIEAGAAKIRLNPGNIKKKTDIYRIIDAAKKHNTAIRIGVNEASIRDLKEKTVPLEKRAELMLKEMQNYVSLFESRGFTDIVLSAKSSDVLRTIEINRLIAEAFEYPIHLGLTHAGLPEDARIPSAAVLGALLSEGIGDTIRVSAAGEPTLEVEIAKEILVSLGLAERVGPELIVCPTCGRSEIDVAALARQVKEMLTKVKKHVRVAVMGCVVNGPGEAQDADIAVCAGKDKGFIYRQGVKVRTAETSQIVSALQEELEKIQD